jgi:hypothetical protein
MPYFARANFASGPLVGLWWAFGGHLVDLKAQYFSIFWFYGKSHTARAALTGLRIDAPDLLMVAWAESAAGELLTAGSAEEALDPSAVGFPTEESFPDDSMEVLGVGIVFRGLKTRAANDQDFRTYPISGGSWQIFLESIRTSGRQFFVPKLIPMRGLPISRDCAAHSFRPPPSDLQATDTVPVEIVETSVECDRLIQAIPVVWPCRQETLPSPPS